MKIPCTNAENAIDWGLWIEIYERLFNGKSTQSKNRDSNFQPSSMKFNQRKWVICKLLLKVELLNIHPQIQQKHRKIEKVIFYSYAAHMQLNILQART